MSRRQLLDLGIPLVLAVAGLIELMTSSDIDAPWPMQILFALGTTVPLLWRRRAPLVVLIVVFGTIAVADMTYDIANNASSPFAGLLVATYASGAYTSRRDGRIAAALIGVAVLAMAITNGEDVVGEAEDEAGRREASPGPQPGHQGALQGAPEQQLLADARRQADQGQVGGGPAAQDRHQEHE